MTTVTPPILRLGANADGSPEGPVVQFAMAPAGIILSGLSLGAFRLWAYLDLKSGSQHYLQYGYGYIGKMLGAKRETVAAWAHELEEHGLVTLTQPTPNSKVHISLTWHPPRIGSPSSGELPPLPPVPVRSHGPGYRDPGSRKKEFESLRSEDESPSSVELVSLSPGDSIPSSSSRLSSDLAMNESSYEGVGYSQSSARFVTGDLLSTIATLARRNENSNSLPAGYVRRIRHKAKWLGIRDDQLPFAWEEFTVESILSVLDLPPFMEAPQPPLEDEAFEDGAYEWETAA